MRLHVLGAGTPTPSSTRFGSSFVVEVGGESVMIDCGPAATHKMVQVGLWPTMIDHLFFTHHHFDHDVDYPCFILCRWDQGAGKERPLNVYGPKLTAQLTERILSPDLGAFAHDWIARVNAPLSQRVHVNRGGTLPRRPPAVSVRELAAGENVSTAKWHVTTSAAVHVQPWLDSLAYRLDSAEGSIVFTGDTEPCDSVVELARGADTLVSMCWDDRDHMAASGENRGQSGIEDAADMAAASGVRRLVLVHMGRHISEAETLQPRLRDVSRLFRGEIIVSQELGVFDL